ncbi:MAG: type II toxin-antitoxin system Phd/YefM family antitoxin [Gemmatimonadetes bacterium]|nr:type II toxin-antitoxin system Phd/YefM family antitoxin [Gemmatimonadota bacterium]
MSEQAWRAKAKKPSTARRKRRQIPAGEFKAVCLQLMDRVKETGEEIVITKRNRPVAKLVPITDADVQAFIGRSRGVITGTREALLAAVDADWEVDADL